MSNKAGTPSNREQAFGYLIEQSISILFEAFNECALFSERSLSPSTAARLDAAIAYLRAVLGEAVPSVNAYASGDALKRELEYAVVNIFTTGDSDLRRTMRGLARARLYAENTRDRLSALAGDKALQSISVSDPEPLSLVLGERSGNDVFILNGNRMIASDKPTLPEDVSSLASAHVRMDQACRKARSALDVLDTLIEAVGRIHYGVEWALPPCAGSVRTPVYTTTAGTRNRVPGHAFESTEQYDDFQNFVGTLTAPANGATEEFVCVDKDHQDSQAIVHATGNGVAIFGVTGLWKTTTENSHGTGCYRTYNTAGAAAADRSMVLIDDAGTSTTTALTMAAAGPAEVISGSARVHYHVLTIPGTNIRTVHFQVSGPGRVTLSFRDNAARANGETTVHQLIGNPMKPLSRVAISNRQKLDMANDIGLGNMLADFLLFRNSASEEEIVSEGWWLQSYARYIFGRANPDPWVNNVELTPSQIGAIRSRMLNSSVWSEFVDFPGFIDKLYYDLKTLRGLVLTGGV